MKQIQLSFRDQETLEKVLTELRTCYDEHSYYGMLLHIYTEVIERDQIEGALKRIEEVLPEALYVGCSSNGNIQNGDFSGDSFLLTCTFFEKETTRVSILQYRLTEETQEEVSRALVRSVDENPWVKGVEFLLTIRGMSLTGLCEGLSKTREDVQIFGGGAFSGDINANEACVFSKEGGYQEKGIVFVLMGGEDLYITSSYVCGWKPLGSFLRITSAEGSILKELNGIKGSKKRSLVIASASAIDDAVFDIGAERLEVPFTAHRDDIAMAIDTNKRSFLSDGDFSAIAVDDFALPTEVGAHLGEIL